MVCLLTLFPAASGWWLHLFVSPIGHDGSVRGVATNDICTELYSCGSDGLLKVN